MKRSRMRSRAKPKTERKRGISWTGFGFPKGETSKDRRDRDQKQERSVKTRIRRFVFNRDPSCVIPKDPRWPHGGIGPDHWAHLEDGRRSRTGGRPAEERHTSMLSCRLCPNHHGMNDREELRPKFLTADGADGPTEWYVAGELVGGGR